MSCPICKERHPHTIDEALAILARTPGELKRLSRGIAAGRAVARPAPGKWSLKEIICHLADCELVYGFRYRKILAEPEPALVGFDQNAWAENLRYRDQPLKGALAALDTLRSRNLELLGAIPKSSWRKTGRHALYGDLSLRQIVAHLVDHDRSHIAQAGRARQGTA